DSAPSGGGLFDSAPSDSAPSGGGLFDSAPDDNAGDLFSSAGADIPTGGLFDANQGAAPTGDSLFNDSDLQSGGGDLFSEADNSNNNGIFASTEAESNAPRVSQEEMMTGQRHENSVLFSLSNLQALAADASPGLSSSSSSDAGNNLRSPGMATNEASGLIDIRAMASSLAAEAEKADDVDEMLSLGGGGFAPTLGAPILTATASQGMSTGVKAAIIGGSILVLALLVAGGIFMWRSSGNQKDDANSEQIMLLMKQIEELKNSKASPEAIKAVQQQLQNAKSDAAVKSGDVAEMPKDDTNEAEADNSKSSSSSSIKSSTKSSSKKDDSKSDNTKTDEPSNSSSSTTTATKPKGNTSALDALLGASKTKPKTAAPTPAPASSGGTKLTRSQVISGMNAVKASVSRCGQGQSGTFKIKAKIAIDGRVDSATPVGDFAGTPQGSCAARAVSKARFPRSSAPTTVTYPFKI
ncbi:MAG: hypothetical protein JXR91_17030, partial [Deltaproteobacteria bacterium]|nr:hypothetical protein [Deltaproteobacteria bacterium]